MAFARVKTYWAEMEATTVATQGSDKSRLPIEHYFEEVLPRARLIESQCSKNVILSYLPDLTLICDREGIDNPLSRWLRGVICFVQVLGDVNSFTVTYESEI